MGGFVVGGCEAWSLLPDPQLGFSVAMAWAFGLIAVSYWVGSRRPRIARQIGVWGAALLPFLLPPQEHTARWVSAGFAIVFAIKAWERGAGRIADPRFWDSFPTFVFWWLVPPDLRWPTHAAEARGNRRVGVRKLCRAAAKLAVYLALLRLTGAYPNAVDIWIVHTLRAMLMIYTLVSAISDLVCGLAMLTGVHVAEVFLSPALSRSPSDFWANRWNRYISGFARRQIFFPSVHALGANGAALAVFLVSGLMHEYLVIACSGRLGSYTGWTTAFFLLHGVGVLVSRALRRMPRFPRAAAVLLHLTWLAGTSPLFFRPLDQSLGFSEWAIPADDSTRWRRAPKASSSGSS
ncbi:MAG: MBOAT family protein [Nannocystaceae bacterium]